MPVRALSAQSVPTFPASKRCNVVGDVEDYGSAHTILHRRRQEERSANGVKQERIRPVTWADHRRPVARVRCRSPGRAAGDVRRTTS